MMEAGGWRGGERARPHGAPCTNADPPRKQSATGGLRSEPTPFAVRGPFRGRSAASMGAPAFGRAGLRAGFIAFVFRAPARSAGCPTEAGARSRAFAERGDYERRFGGPRPCLRVALCPWRWLLRIGGGFSPRIAASGGCWRARTARCALPGRGGRGGSPALRRGGRGGSPALRRGGRGGSPASLLLPPGCWRAPLRFHWRHT